MMGTKLNRDAYEKLIAEDIERLRREMPHSLERDHIEAVLRCSPEREYGGGEAAQESVSVCEAYALELRRDAADMEARNVNPLQVNQLRAMASGVEVASSRIAAIRGYVPHADEKP